MSYRATGEVLTSVCTKDAHCGGGYLCCQGTCATADESLCADHPGYQSKYDAPPPSDTPPTYSPPASKPASPAKSSHAAVVLGVMAVVAALGGGVYVLSRRRKR